MRMDDGAIDQKLSLDMTPLIDVVFLLVLFFAVSTSFISAEDLEKLRQNASGLADRVQQLLQSNTDAQEDFARRESRLQDSLSVSQTRVQSLQSDLVSEREQIVQSAIQLEELQRSNQQLQDTQAALELQMGQASQEQDQLRTQIGEQSGRMELLESELDEQKDNVLAAEQRIASLSTQLTNEQESNRSLQADLITARSELKASSDLNTNVSDRVAQLLRQLETARLEHAQREELLSQSVAQSEQQIASYEEQLTASRSETSDANDQINQVQAELDRVKNDNLQLQNTAREYDGQRQALTQQLNERDSQYQQLQQQLNEQTTLQSEADTRLTEVNTRLAALQQENQRLNDQYAADLEKSLQEIKSANQLATDLRTDNSTLREQVENTRTELDDANARHTAELQAATDRIAAQDGELARFRELAGLDQEQLQRMIRAQKQISEGLSGYLADNKLGIKRDQEQLILQLSDKILFASGRARLKDEGLEVLRELGAMLTERVGDLAVQIGGHTDNIPLGAGARFGDNWGLSAARAANVVRFFEQELDIDASRLSAVGYGEYRPVADNSTSTGRARNRRIEIVLLPR